MIADVTDVVPWTYWIVDDIWQRLAPRFRRPGPQPAWSDSELLTMAIVGHCRGWNVETELVSQWHERRDVFPPFPARRRFNRRLRTLLPALNLVRRAVVALVDVAQDRQYAIDRVPVPVVQVHLAPQASRDWAVHGATFGNVVTKKPTVVGDTLQRLVTLKGVMVDCILAPVHGADLTVGAELLHAHTDVVVLGDNGYISAPLATELGQHNRVQVLSIPRRNHHRTLPPMLTWLRNAQRQMIETVHDQLTEQVHGATNHAHSFWRLCTRLHTKPAAHTVSIYLNRLLGNVDCLQIKRLAFPN